MLGDRGTSPAVSIAMEKRINKQWEDRLGSEKSSWAQEKEYYWVQVSWVDPGITKCNIMYDFSPYYLNQNVC